MQLEYFDIGLIWTISWLLLDFTTISQQVARHTDSRSYSHVYRRMAHYKHDIYVFYFCTGGAAFAAFKLYEHQQTSNGHPVSHPGAKAALAALAGFEVGLPPFLLHAISLSNRFSRAFTALKAYATLLS